MYQLRVLRWAVLLVAFSAFSQTTPKRPLNHRDYDGWNSIQSQVLSRDGKFLAYSLVPEEGDGQLVVRNLVTGKELRENCGAAPPAAENTGEEPTGEGPPPVRAIRIVFSHDNAFLIASTFPQKADTDKARKERKRPDEMPRGGMIVVNLSTLSAARVADVASFQVPELGDGFVAYLRGPKAAGTPVATENDDEDQARGGRGGNTAGRARNKYGSDLVVRDLTSARERTLEDVLEFSVAKDGKALLYAVGSKKEETNGVYSVAPGSDAAPAALLSGKGQYSRLTWDLAGRRFAFLSNRDDQSSKPAKFKAYLWDRSGAAAEIVSTSTAGFRSGYGILDRGPISFSRDGSHLFLSCAPLDEIAALEKEPSPPAPVPSDDKVQADLWSWRDDYVQAMQKVRAAQERSRSYRAVYRFSDKTFLQISDPTMAGLVPSDDGRVALGTDDRAYRRMVDYDGAYNDVYLVDTATGKRTLALKQFRGAVGTGGGRGGAGGGGGMQLSADGAHALAFKDKAWWSIGVPDGKLTNLSAAIGTAVYNEDDDHPEAAPAYGAAGWTKDGKWALIYDRYDVWAVSPGGASPRKLTDGRKSELQFRVVRLDSDAQDEERGIDPAKSMLLRAENLETRDSGFYSLASFGATPQKLIMGAKNYRTLGKAKDADVIMVTATTFHDEPDIHITDSSFRSLKPATEANPQKKQILWGTGEMIHYRNADGVLLEAALYKPENFDPSKKYPMMVYLYERLSQNLNAYVKPAPGHSINITYYVSNGYLVLTPDIIYTTGHPGQSALKCILPAIQAVVDKGYVNRDAIGIQGHSWGGYQTAYLITQTNVFKAAEAGAPVANMISAYDGIRWGSGLPRQFQYEKTQSRIGGTIWEYPMRFIENSPIFMVDRVTTPLLILQNDADDAVPWYQGLELFLSLRRLGKEVYLFDYNGEPHHINRRPNQKDYTVRLQQFFDHFLKGAPEPEWMQKGIPYIDRDQEKEKFNATTESSAGDQKDIRK
ncbi:MAG TPA: prolyl oligopeptidase family serine peptidase [Bryobacteraceae bacterium]|nr:prolyl oligopeptidase family serine peptidase [Bryobacteraceae bacterium]